MTGLLPLAALLAGLSTWLLLSRPGDVRLARLLPGAGRRPTGSRSGPGAAAAPRPDPSGRGSPSSVLACAVAGVAVALLVTGVVGLVLGLSVAVVGPRLVGQLEPAASRAERVRLEADLPLLLDLLSSCLAGGASLQEAARVVAAAVPGPAGERLAAVHAQLAVGAPPAAAWATLTSAAAGHPSDRLGPAASSAADDPLGPAARALGRAAEGGAPVAAAVARLAADARAQSRSEGEQRARRVGVLVVAPLGLCFLPAFVLLGVVPVVVGLAGPLLATL
jgi:pilus assembly protein TadC